MKFKEEDHLEHYGTPRKSGRYPYGSGGDPEQRHTSFLKSIDDMKAKGLSDKEIYTVLGMTSTQYRAEKSNAKNAVKRQDIQQAVKLKLTGMSNSEIGREMGGRNESSIRALLADDALRKVNILSATSDMLRDKVDSLGAIDVGSGIEYHLGISRNKLDNAIHVLKGEGYLTHKVYVDQLGTGKQTTIRVLAKPEMVWSEMMKNPSLIRPIQEFSADGGESWVGIQPPLNVSAKRVQIKYKEQGGDAADGVIYLRRGVDDISLGGATYAQVRISVDGTHYIKGMAMHKDDLPAGVDIQFNTNKSDTGNKLDALKPIKSDPENPFGSVVHQKFVKLPDGTIKVTNALNIVGNKEGSGEEGAWDKWSKSLSTQMLSKQKPALAKQQLDETFATKKADLDEIRALTNPAVRKKLLDDYADGADSSAVKLRAAALPRQRNAVILPINTLKDTEVFAPNFKDGETVALIRYPHGGIFEIPELQVNNRNREGRKLLGADAKDAIGINSKVAARLSGADFDGDTVLVIPTGNSKASSLKTMPPLEGLKNFDAQARYKLPDEAPRMSARTKGIEMGKVSNLITDMTLQSANTTELAAAVRHSMVVIDAEKHHLDYRQSAKDNGIAALTKKYQPGKGAGGGASTLISRAGREVDIPERKARAAADGGPIDKRTGKLEFVPTGNSYVNKAGKTVMKTIKVKELASVDDARSLSSGTKMEEIYANHSNRMKALANEARKESLSTPSMAYSPSAKKVYASEVESLNAKLNVALKNSPVERAAQVAAGAKYRAKVQADPDMDKAEKKKLRNTSLEESRTRLGAKKVPVDITAKEWEAIQAGAISQSKLESIMNNADMEKVKALATPRTNTVMTGAKQAKAQALLSGGKTYAEVAAILGVPVSTVKSSLEGGG